MTNPTALRTGEDGEDRTARVAEAAERLLMPTLTGRCDDGVYGDAGTVSAFLHDLSARAEQPATPLPFWQEQPCPRWCDDKHSDADHPDDRVHMLLAEDGRTVALSRHAPCSYGGTDWRSEVARVNLQQHVDQAAPALDLCLGDQRATFHLTAQEARQLADALTFVADLAEGHCEVTA